jgi:hypothetical protein
MLVTVFQPVTSENLPGQPSILSFFSETGPTAKVVLGILLFFSLVSWAIIFAKFIRLRRVSRQSEKFVTFFRKSKRFSEVNTFAGELSDTPLTTLFKAGYAELDAQVKAIRAEDNPTTAGGAGGKLLIKNISGIERALERAIGVEMSRLTRSMTFLATTAAACPVPGDRPDRLDVDRRGRARDLGGARQHRGGARGGHPGADLLQLLHGQGPRAARRNGGLLARVHQSGGKELHLVSRCPRS